MSYDNNNILITNALLLGNQKVRYIQVPWGKQYVPHAYIKMRIGNRDISATSKSWNI
jgi:hypothetical protein